eukprot:2808727-Rhodomonas_salina.2
MAGRKQLSGAAPFHAPSLHPTPSRPLRNVWLAQLAQGQSQRPKKVVESLVERKEGVQEASPHRTATVSNTTCTAASFKSSALALPPSKSLIASSRPTSDDTDETMSRIARTGPVVCGGCWSSRAYDRQIDESERCKLQTMPT